MSKFVITDQVRDLETKYFDNTNAIEELGKMLESNSDVYILSDKVTKRNLKLDSVQYQSVILSNIERLKAENGKIGEQLDQIDSVVTEKVMPAVTKVLKDPKLHKFNDFHIVSGVTSDNKVIRFVLDRAFTLCRNVNLVSSEDVIYAPMFANNDALRGFENSLISHNYLKGFK